MKRLLVGAVLVILGLGYLSMRATDQVFTGIVADKSFTGLTSNFSGTVLYTPDVAGVFRVTVCAVNSGYVGGVSETVNWTDSFSNAKSDQHSISGGGPFCQAVSFVASSGHDITLDGGSITGLGYSVDMYATVERLQ